MTQFQVYPPVARAGVQPTQHEISLMQSVMSKALPEWQHRLNQALNKPTPLIVNFDALLALAPNPQARLAALQVLVGTLPKHGSCLLDGLVAAVELACHEPAVRDDMAGKIGQIDFVNLPPAAKSSDKSLAFHGPTFVITVNLAAGLNGGFRQENFAAFFEQTCDLFRGVLSGGLIRFGAAGSSPRSATLSRALCTRACPTPWFGLHCWSSHGARRNSPARDDGCRMSLPRPWATRWCSTWTSWPSWASAPHR